MDVQLGAFWFSLIAKRDIILVQLPKGARETKSSDQT